MISRSIERVFTNPEVQRILLKLTKFPHELPKSPGLQRSQIHLMTREQFEKAQIQARNDVERDLLKMPPVMDPWEPPKGIIEVCPELDNHADTPIGFVDISPLNDEKDRVAIVRQTNGNLEHASNDQRSRWMQIFFDRPLRSVVPPEMFKEPYLEEALKQNKHEYILECVCHQYEPYDSEFIRVTNRIYFHVDENALYNLLATTRFFGPMCLNLVWHQKTQGLTEYFTANGSENDLNWFNELIELMYFSLIFMFLPVLNGLFFDIRETDEKCFIEEIPEDTTVNGKYRLQVADPQSKMFVEGDTKFGIFVQVRDPDSKEMMNKLYTSSGMFTFTSHTAGEHTICLKTNSTAWFGGSLIRVHLDIAVGEHAIDYEKVGVAEKLNEIQIRVRQLIDQSHQIIKEQNYQRMREEHFRDLSERINSRVFRWALAQLAVLCIIAFWQMKHLRAFFRAKKLV